MKKYKIYRVFKDGKSWLNIAYGIDEKIEIIESYNGTIRQDYYYDDSLKVESDMSEVTPEEMDNLFSILNKHLKEWKFKSLSETDWYIIRLQEIGQEIPEEILEIRQSIRDKEL
jgi:transcription termination factor NusB